MDDWIKSVPTHLGKSSFLPQFAQYYAMAPSAVLIRTAEAELVRALPIEPPALDLCCGDGFFASSVYGPRFEAGLDLNHSVLRQAATRASYGTLACADVARGIPFGSGYFNTIVSNSSLEHIDNIDNLLTEIARVLRQGGRLYATFASHFAYEWWPCGPDALNRYLTYQPVHNRFSIQDWERRMGRAGMRVVGHWYYLSKTVTRVLLFLDYHVSRVDMTSDSTVARPFIRTMRRIQPEVWTWLWEKLFATVKILAQGKGGGILIIAERGCVS